MSYLMVLEGLESGKIYPLLPYNTIGTAAENTIVLRDQRVLTHQVFLKKQGEGYWFANPGQDDNVRLNSQPVETAYLRHCDTINIGNTTLIFLDKVAEQPHETHAGESKSHADNIGAAEILSCINPHDYAKVLEDGRSSKTSGRLSMLMHISSAISEIHKVDILLKCVLTIVCRYLPVDRGFILLNKGGNKYENKASLEKSWRDKARDEDLQHSRTITRKVLARRSSFLCNPSSADTNTPTNMACIGVPLNCKGKLLGLIQLESFCGVRFTRNDLDQLRKVSLLVAMAIENIHTHHQPVRYRKHLLTLGKVSQSLARHLEQKKIIREGTLAAKTLFNSTRVSILLVDAQKSYFLIAAAVGIPPEEWDSTHIPVEGSIAGRVFLKNEPLVISNFERLPEGFNVRHISVANYQSQSCILAPLRITHPHNMKEETIGVICVTDKEDCSRFTILERNLLSLLANQIGAVLTNAQLYEKATIDPLTNLLVRSYFFQRLQEEMRHACKHGKPLCFAMMDLDHFKTINDKYSHQTGDRVLEQLGAALKSFARPNEAVGRYGGEEFMLLLPYDCDKAMERAGEIHARIARNPFWLAPNEPIFMTVSIGVSCMRPDDSLPLFIQRADKSLYIAKHKGRNMVVSEAEIEEFEKNQMIKSSIQSV